ncbi:hypothetical protein PMAYCL1PPCAC_25836, partial [Pristionchus mayeri]
ISFFDLCYVHSTNSLFMVAGSKSGDIAIRWDSGTNNHYINYDKIKAREVLFFGKESTTGEPQLNVIVDDTTATVRSDSGNGSQLLHQVPIRSGDNNGSRAARVDQVHVITSGYDEEKHDIWLVTSHEVILHPEVLVLFFGKEM